MHGTNYTGSRFIRALIDYSTLGNRLSWLLLFALLIAYGFSEATDLRLYEVNEQYLYAAIWVAYLLAVAAPAYRLSMKGHTTIVVVVIWSVISLLVTLLFAYTAYFATTANLAIDPSKSFANGIPPTVDLKALFRNSRASQSAPDYSTSDIRSVDWHNRPVRQLPNGEKESAHDQRFQFGHANPDPLNLQ